MEHSEKQKILAYWESGMSIAQIRAVTGHYAQEIVQALREMGAGQRPTCDQRIVALFNSGVKNAPLIARELGVSQKTVYHALYANGLRIGGKSRIFKHNEKTRAIARDLESGGMSQSEIAKKHGVSRQYVSQVARKIREGLV
jgi:DNA-binding CsgD family transcriptional regulator